MKYYTLLRGRSKQRLKPVMVDSLEKVEGYKKALQSSDGGTGKTWHYGIEEALPDDKAWRKNNSTKWTNYNSPNPPKVKNGSRS